MKKLPMCLIFLSGLFASCKDFIEESVENQKIILLAPGDSTESSLYNQTFWWEGVEDALVYRLQVVSPTFDSISFLAVDTLVKTDKFAFTLDPGKYQWRVRAENGSSKSLYTIGSFTIHESSIENQRVQLKAPGTNFYTSQQEIVYKWERLFGAQVYRLQLDSNNFEDENNLVFDQTSESLQLTVSFSKEKNYQWRVRAENENEQSKWSAVHKITFDKTPPGIVTLNSPADNSTNPKPVNLQWNAVPDAEQYELLVLKSDSTTAFSSIFPLTLKAAAYTFNLGSSNEKIYWKVRAVDEAGNKGPYSMLRKFYIQ